MRELFEKYGEIDKITFGRDINDKGKDDYAFINFKLIGPAETAINDSEIKEIRGTRIEVNSNRKTDLKAKFNRKASLGQFHQISSYSRTSIKKGAKPINYKSQICKHFEMYSNCPKGLNCNYAHGKQELRPISLRPGGPTHAALPSPVVSPMLTAAYKGFKNYVYPATSSAYPSAPIVYPIMFNTLYPPPFLTPSATSPPSAFITYHTQKPPCPDALRDDLPPGVDR